MNLTDEEKLIREKIINVARHFAMADGLYNVSLEDVINSAEVTEETFYKVFRDFDELMMNLVTTRFGLTDENVLSLPLEEKIKVFISGIMTQVETASIDDFRKWIKVNVEPKDNALILSDKEILRKLLKTSIESGELQAATPLDDFVEFVVSLLYGLTLNWSMTDGKFEPLEKMDSFSDFIINALTPYMN